MRTGLTIALGMALALVAPSALAQDPQPGTDTGAGTGTGMGTGAGAEAGGTAAGTVDANAAAEVEPPKVTTTTKTTTTTDEAGAGAAAAKDDGLTDHEKVVGHFGVGYLGLTQLPIGSGGVTGVNRATIDAPVIGVRYWLMEKLGLDLGIGFTFFSSSRAVEAAGTPGVVETDGPAALGLAFHGGLPLAFAHAKHYKFLLIPEFNVGFTRRGEKQNAPPGAAAPPDIVRSGFRLDVGARVGTEIQFGFIGVPELALQATVGLNFRRQVWKNSQDAFLNTPAQSSSDGETSVGTTVQSDPWALFVNNISAIYYFP